MGKPIVRVVIDKDALLKMFPEGDFEAQLAFDNSVVNLIQETVKRLFNQTFIAEFEKQFKESVAAEFSSGNYSRGPNQNTRELVKNAIKVATEGYAKDAARGAAEESRDELEALVKERFTYAKKYIIEATAPENIDILLTKAAAAIIRGQVK